MNYRLATLLARTTISSDLTTDIDIDVKDVISQLVVVYDCLNATTANADGHPAECVTKIELIDGSDVLYSMSGVEAQAADFYHNRFAPSNHLRYLDANYSYQVFNLNFGRKLWDMELGLDPSKFSNLKLRISITRGAGGIASVAGRLTVLAKLFDEKPVSPIGFLMHKEIKTYTLGDSSHDYTDLPLDHPYRKILIRAQRDGAAIDEQLENVKLTQDADKVVPFNLNIMNVLRAMVSECPPYRETIMGSGTTVARYFFSTPTYRVGFAGASWRATAGFGQVSFYDGDGGYCSEIQDGVGGNFCVVCEGHLPHAVFEIPFGDQMDIHDWFDVSGIGNLKLDLTGGSSVDTKTCQIMLQQLRRY